MHFARLSNTLQKDEESTRDNHVLAYNFAKYSPILIVFTLRLSIRHKSDILSALNCKFTKESSSEKKLYIG